MERSLWRGVEWGSGKGRGTKQKFNDEDENQEHQEDFWISREAEIIKTLKELKNG